LVPIPLDEERYFLAKEEYCRYIADNSTQTYREDKADDKQKGYDDPRETMEDEGDKEDERGDNDNGVGLQ